MHLLYFQTVRTLKTTYVCTNATIMVHNLAYAYHLCIFQVHIIYRPTLVRVMSWCQDFRQICTPNLHRSDLS